MSVQIVPFKSSINTSYIIKEQGAVIFDGAWSGDRSAFLKLLDAHEIKPDEIKLIILSHSDFDHTNGVPVIRELTGAQVAIHEKDREKLEKGIFNWPEGTAPWGKVSRAVLQPLFERRMSPPPIKADIVLDNRDVSLEPYGISGKILYTPGHTHGSVSVLLDSGDAFIGCLAHSGLPFRLRPGLPIYATDMELVKQSWRYVLDHNVRTVYPAHGNAFPADRIHSFIN